MCVLCVNINYIYHKPYTNIEVLKDGLKIKNYILRISLIVVALRSY